MTTSSIVALDGIRIDVAVGPMLGPVVARAVSAACARAGLTLDRVDDAVLVADAVCDGIAREAVDARLPIVLQPTPSRVSLRFGPLREGAGARLLHGGEDPVPGAQIIQLLASRARVTGGGARSEYLIVELGQDG